MILDVGKKVYDSLRAEYELLVFSLLKGVVHNRYVTSSVLPNSVRVDLGFQLFPYLQQFSWLESPERLQIMIDGVIFIR